MVTKGRKGQHGTSLEFMRDRIMGPGKDPKPTMICRGLYRIGKDSVRYPDLKLSEPDERRLALTLHTVTEHNEASQADKETFLIGFWAGYSLHDFGSQGNVDIAAPRADP